jgi:hypothetical protein
MFQNRSSVSDPVTQAVAAMVSALRERGWEYPICILAAGSNRNIHAVEYVADGVAERMFVGHGRHDFERFTIQMTFVDSSGQSRPGMLTIDASQDRRNDSVDVHREVGSSRMETAFIRQRRRSRR